MNEMDPNIVIIRLGADLDGNMQGSGPLGSVHDGDVFSVNFKRANFEHKRDAIQFSGLNRGNTDQFY